MEDYERIKTVGRGAYGCVVRFNWHYSSLFLSLQTTTLSVEYLLLLISRETFRVRVDDHAIPHCSLRWCTVHKRCASNDPCLSTKF